MSLSPTKSPTRGKKLPVTLYTAAHDNDVATLAKLIEKNVNPVGQLREVDEKKNSPLHYAAYVGAYEACLLLVECCKIDAVNLDGYTPFLFAAWSGRAKICAILMDKKANINRLTLKRDHAIHLASQDEHFHVVDLLIHRGYRRSTWRRQKRKTGKQHCILPA